ncbi:MAG: hypothetical protein M1831_004630 [Alyxoria varia]|nr:MAG: hypothetical protein M1831_004630 [Alyxoria varia]
MEASSAVYNNISSSRIDRFSNRTGRVPSTFVTILILCLEFFRDAIPQTIYRVDPRRLKIGETLNDLPIFLKERKDLWTKRHCILPNREFVEELLFQRVLRECEPEAFGILKVIHAQADQLLEYVQTYESGVVPGVNRESGETQEDDKESKRKRIWQGICKVWAWDPSLRVLGKARHQSFDSKGALWDLGKGQDFGCRLKGESVPGLIESLDATPRKDIFLAATHFASLAGHVELAKFLGGTYRYRKDLKIRFPLGTKKAVCAAPILAAACTSNQPGLVKYFLESDRVFAARLKLNTKSEGADIRCMVQAAVSTGSLEMLRVFWESPRISKVLRPNELAEFHRATLCFAIATGQQKIMEFMLESKGAHSFGLGIDERISGAMMHLDDRSGVSPLISAIISGQEDTACRLIALNADPNLSFSAHPKDAPPPLYFAARHCSPRVVRALRNKGAKFQKYISGDSKKWRSVKVGLGALEGAASSGNNRVIEELANMKLDAQVQVQKKGLAEQVREMFAGGKDALSTFEFEHRRITRGEVAHMLALANCHRDTARLIVKLGLYQIDPAPRAFGELKGEGA